MAAADALLAEALDALAEALPEPEAEPEPEALLPPLLEQPASAMPAPAATAAAALPTRNERLDTYES